MPTAEVSEIESLSVNRRRWSTPAVLLQSRRLFRNPSGAMVKKKSGECDETGKLAAPVYLRTSSKVKEHDQNTRGGLGGPGTANQIQDHRASHHGQSRLLRACVVRVLCLRPRGRLAHVRCSGWIECVLTVQRAGYLPRPDRIDSPRIEKRQVFWRRLHARFPSQPATR